MATCPSSGSMSDAWRLLVDAPADGAWNMAVDEILLDGVGNHRDECCLTKGGHFRLESQTPEGEALRDDDNFAFVAAWEYKGDNQPEVLNKEMLDFEFVHLTQRSYK